MKFSLGNISKSVLYFFLPLVVLIITSWKLLAPFVLHLWLIDLVIVVGLGFVKQEKWQPAKLVFQALLVLLLVGGTGWFLSPFFFLLYLLPLYLGFLYTPAVAFSFLAALLIIFAFSVGEVDTAFDSMTLVSLLLVVPLVIYLRKKYLVIKQATRDILILEEEGGITDADTIRKLLANRVTNLGVSIRQPLTFIKQAATVLMEEKISEKEAATYVERIRTTATEALEQVRAFETTTSANKVLTNDKGKTIAHPNSL